jgi:hypothetical protein
MKVKAAKARPARIEAAVAHVRAALDAKQAAPKARTTQKTIGPTFPYRNALYSRHVICGVILISFMKDPAKRPSKSKKQGSPGKTRHPARRFRDLPNATIQAAAI